MDTFPVVSCIMPTRNRREFVGQGIWYFLRQDYEQRELIIVDDGSDAVRDLIPNDPRIKYVYLEQPCRLNVKRNIACGHSQGSLIAHWDDDDWQSPQRLRRQVQCLNDANYQLCGLVDVPHYQLQAGRAWKFQPLHPGTLLYRRSLWQQFPFDESKTDLDAFLSIVPGHQQHWLDAASLYVAILHSANWRSQIPKAPFWQRQDLSEALNLIGYDVDFYVGLRNRHLKAALKPAPSSSSVVTLVSMFLVYDGYGSMAEYLALGMMRAGALVQIQPLKIDWEGLSDEFTQYFRNTKPKEQAPYLYFCWPDAIFDRYRTAGDIVINTMWESSRLPLGWADRINQAQLAIVPTRFVARVFRDSGVNIPVVVIPEGIDPLTYPHMDRPDRDVFTTLIVGPVTDRKHTLEAIAAWKMAFEADPDARLVIKARFKYSTYQPDDPRIQLVDTDEKTRGIAQWYYQADALMALGSEGFGLPLVEGMATGLPVVALNAEGQADVCQEAMEYVLPVEPACYKPYESQIFGRCGEFAIPDVEQTATHLRWIKDHRDEARLLGRQASAWAHQYRNIWHKAPAVLDVMEQHIQPVRALRRTYTFMNTSWGRTCGVAEYTRHLSRHLNGLKVINTDNVDQWDHIRLLHIQHEPSLISPSRLLDAVQQGRRIGRPVIITEHAVLPYLHSWERDASALVALNSLGAQQLQHNWPGKQVHHIPIGCHTSFPPLRSRRGNVIAVFGFLERHKGFWDLLNVLRALPDTSLLMFSHARSPELLEEWRRDAAGLPVRHVSAYLSEEDVMAQLAAEADMVVFWYQPFPFYSASASACLALASGVPVLTSPTSWFHDLRNVTYQPDELIDGVKRLLDDTELREDLTGASREYCYQHSWENIAKQHQTLWQSILEQ